MISVFLNILKSLKAHKLILTGHENIYITQTIKVTISPKGQFLLKIIRNTSTIQLTQVLEEIWRTHRKRRLKQKGNFQATERSIY